MPPPDRTPTSHRRIALGLAAIAALAVLSTLIDPGMTIDEPLDVAPGRKYVRTLMTRGLGFFEPATVRHVFADNAEHPPLGRWLLGLASVGFEPIELIVLGKDPVGLYVRAGRAAPALCFALLVGLVTAEAARRSGRAGGVAAGLSLILMPRVFGHAHLAALDTFVALTWTAGWIAASRAIASRRRVVGMALAGLVWGLALLTKIHGWLLIPVVGIWALARLPLRRAVPALAAWTLTGLATFVAGWPWLWYETGDRLAAYLRTGVERTPILVRYLGATYRDVDVPWHYPWILFLATVPIVPLAYGLWGARVGWRERRDDPSPLLPAGIVLGWLALFSTGVAVYDGVRLFLPAFPAWAVVVGLGFADGWDSFAATRRSRALMAATLLAPALGLGAIHPFALSYYSPAVGGLRGADRLGLELTYWGDAVDPVLLDRLAALAQPNDPAALAPTLAPGQGAVATARALARLPVVLEDEQAVGRSEWVVLYRRPAYWSDEVRRLVDSPPVAVRSRQGVWLSGLWRRPTEKNAE